MIWAGGVAPLLIGAIRTFAAIAVTGCIAAITIARCIAAVAVTRRIAAILLAVARFAAGGATIAFAGRGLAG